MESIINHISKYFDDITCKLDLYTLVFEYVRHVAVTKQDIIDHPLLLEQLDQIEKLLGAARAQSDGALAFTMHVTKESSPKRIVNEQ